MRSIEPSKSRVIQVLRAADAVCFDVDSTVCTGELIDELAEFCDKGAQVKEITSKAMSGGMEFRDALKIRLDVINPSRSQVEAMLVEKPPTITPRLEKLMETLKQLNIKPYLVSGGFECFIHPVADQLGIDRKDVYANRLLFNSSGRYAGFDTEALTSCSGGKGRVVELLKMREGHATVVMIGDGVTDMEASPPADAFIGFGGNVVREAVKSKASWFVTDFQEIIDVLLSPPCN